MNVVLVAEESAGLGVLRQLTSGPHHTVAVLAKDHAAPRGPTVAAVARQMGLPVWPAARVRDPALAATLRAADVDLLLNVHSLFIADAAVVEAPAIGAFNMHPGPLPRYAGLNAPSWAILAGETDHAVTLHRMQAGIDTGAIAYEHYFDIEPTDTGLKVALKCVSHGLALVARLLEDAAAGTIPAIQQDLDRRRYFDRKPPYEGRLPWSLPARTVTDLVRAADYRPFPSPWGHPATRLDGQRLRVVEARRTGERSDAPAGTVGRVDERGALVAAADEWVLMTRVQRADDPVSDAGSVLRDGAELT